MGRVMDAAGFCSGQADEGEDKNSLKELVNACCAPKGQGLKPADRFLLSARLKACPDTEERIRIDASEIRVGLRQVDRINPVAGFEPAPPKIVASCEDPGGVSYSARPGRKKECHVLNQNQNE